MSIRFIFIFLLFTQGGELYSQSLSWVKRLKDFNIHGSAVDQNGKMYFTGYFLGNAEWGDTTFTSSVQRFFIAKTSETGELEWFIRSSQGIGRTTLQVDYEGNIVICGMAVGNIEIDGQPLTPSSNGQFLLKLDPLGNIIWYRAIRSRFYTNRFEFNFDEHSNIYIATTMYGEVDLGSNFQTPNGNQNVYSVIMKLQKDGQTAWALSGSNSGGEDVVYNRQGKLYYLGNRSSASTNYFILGTDTITNILNGTPAGSGEALFLAKVDTSGTIDTVLFSNTTQDGFILGDRLLFSQQGHLYVQGRRRHRTSLGISDTASFLNRTWSIDSAYPTPVFIVRVDSNFNIDQEIKYSLTLDQFFHPELVQGTEGNLYFAGFTPSFGLSPHMIFPDTVQTQQDYDMFISSFSPMGQYLWTLPFTDSLSQTQIGLVQLSHGRILLHSTFVGPFILDGFSSPDQGNYQLLAVIYGNIQNAPNLVRGILFADSNQNCSVDNTELKFGNRMVWDLNSQTFAFSDSQGLYSLPLDTGDVVIEVAPSPFPYLISNIACPPTGFYPLNLDTVGIDTFGFDFAIENVDCPYLTVNISTNQRRFCDVSTSYINFSNIGTDTAFNVKVFFTLPENVTLIGTSHPAQLLSGMVYEVELDTLTPNEYGQITIQDSVSCSNVNLLGRILCTETWIEPANTCISSGLNWDGSELSVHGNCSGSDSVDFVLRISQSSPITDSVSYRLFTDGLITDTGKWWVNGLDSLILTVPFDAGGVRLEVDQISNHPFESWVADMVDNCFLPSPPLGSSLDMFSLVDDIPHHSAECLPITGSYDPNDKSTSPKGQTESHFIEHDTRIKYKIRFQNTGTDTAFRVVIIDSLDTDLDYQSIILGNSSHPYSYHFTFDSNKAIVHFEFDPIVLPDSGADLEASNGMITFSIKPKDSLVSGTEILNSSEIYFDYNPPIITNTVEHTIVDSLFRCSPSAALAGDDVILCNLTSYQLNAEEPLLGVGNWKKIEGTGVIADSMNSNTIIINLSLGRNLVLWETRYCDKVSQDTIVIYVDSFESSVSILQFGDTLTSDVTASHYNWYWNDSLLLDTMHYIIPQRSGNYKVEAVSENCGTITSSEVPIILNHVEALNFETSILTYKPNPVTDKLMWEINDFGKLEHNFKIVNVLGQSFLEKRIKSNQGEIMLSGIPNGIYFILLDERYVGKIVKKD